MAQITDIEGIGEAYAAKLKDAGVGSVEALLEKAGASSGRAALESATGISGALLLRWVNHADLYRIKGIAAQYAELLEAAGVDSVPELAQRNAASLTQKLTEANLARNIANRTPSETEVGGWIAQARALPRTVTH